MRWTSRLSASDLGQLGGAADPPWDALVLEMDEQFGQPALDRFEVAEAGVGGVELFDQPGDPVLEMADRRLVGARELQPFELVGEGPIDRRLSQLVMRRAFLAAPGGC